jgi:hypothetical protein
MADSSDALQGRRMNGILRIAGGYIAGRVASRLLTNQLDPGARPDSATVASGGLLGAGASWSDDLVVLGGAGYSGYRVLKSRPGKADFWVGMMIGAGSPLLDGIVDRITDAVGSALPGGGA